ncbi:MAG TPA: 4-hydroxy-3-methylbut-2-enyl diphosphate reductase [Chloroflexota bacterium]|jgi:4-hydroxy-3-methylbut-2-enyl diphosphate reductase|nr:4-hydroxy-3-methylbut-2-enyl diphosphate reductase [Chloroflexota bacterium]
MQIVRAARYGGFCGGVKRAWTLALQTRQSTAGPVYVTGELIHNRPAMAELQAKGIEIANPLERELPAGSTVLVRAHGEGPQVYERARAQGLRLIDASCGIVQRVQRRAAEWEAQGYQVILFGHRNHPEARATIAYTKHGLIIESVAEAEALPHFPKIAALAQTTVLLADYQAVCRVLATKCDEFQDQGQICAWTRLAQDEALAIARTVDVMVVVGGKHSSNTRQLAKVCSAVCPTYHIETADELDPAWFQGVARVGLTAGASTRDADVEAVAARLASFAQPAPA